MAIGLYTALQLLISSTMGMKTDDVNRGNFIARENYPLPRYPVIFIDNWVEDVLYETSITVQPSVVTRVRCLSQNDDEAYTLALALKTALNTTCSEPFANIAIAGLQATVHPDGVFEYSYNFTLTLMG